MGPATFNYQKMGHSSFPTKQLKQNIKEKSNLNLKTLPLSTLNTLLLFLAFPPPPSTYCAQKFFVYTNQETEGSKSQ
jgi:hypothetical protein